MIAPAPKLKTPAPRRPPDQEEPLLLVDVVAPGAYVSEARAIRRWRWAAAVVALFAPASQFLLPGATATGLMWITMVFGLGGVWAAERFRWAPAAWFAAAGATPWSFFAVQSAVAAPEGPLPALFLLVLALAGLWRMRRAPAAGAALMLGVAAATAYAAFNAGAASPYGAALAVIAACAAVAGGALRKLEPALGLGWVIACVGLFALSGQPAAHAWLWPALALFGALFFAIEALALPAVGRAGLLIAAVGAISPLMAIGALYGADLGLGGRAGQATAYLIAAAGQAGVLALCRRRLGDLKALGIAIAPVGVAIAAALIAAAEIALHEVWGAAALALAALAFSRLHQRAPHRMWAAAALILMLAACVEAARTIWLVVDGDDGRGATGLAALSIIAIGLAAPALSAALAARDGPARAPIVNAAFEGFAVGLGFAALVGVVRWIAAGGAPASPALGFGEAGAHASLWFGAGALLLLCPDRGAQSVRRPAALALFILASAALAFGAVAWLNPWWGGYPAPADGLPVLNPLAVGYLAPAFALVGFVWLARRRDSRGFAIAAACAAAACVLLWLALELRRAFHGPDIAGAGVFGAENAALSALLLAAALALRASRRFVDATERVCAAALALAILAKVAFIDIYQPTDGWRAASLVLLAFAGAALAAPRGERAIPATAGQRLWRALHYAAAHA